MTLSSKRVPAFVRDGFRLVGGFALAGALLLLTTPAPAPAQEADAAGIELTVVLRGIQPDRPGGIRCALWASGSGWPSNRNQAVTTTAARGNGAMRTCRFTVPSEGRYAVSAHHDYNGNRTVDRNMFGAPTEAWGTTRNVTHALRGPSFEESAIDVAGPRARAVINMHY